MVFIFNTIINPIARDNFTNIIAPRITFGKKYTVIAIEDNVPDLNQFTHLLLTGSELSASKGSEWDEKIFKVINHFLKNDKSILGICHGHQMIARAVSGDQVCRRSSRPEFGWKKMETTKNRIFENILQPVFLESRYDEVYDLDERFEIITFNDQLKVQSFQLRNRPVWGVQFHPEMLWEDGNKMLESHLRDHVEDRKYFTDEMENRNLITANLNIFRNFFKS